MLRVRDGKGGKYRETPIPTELATTISTVADVREASTSAPLLDVTTRTLRRWVKKCALELVETTDDEGWRYLSFHDLRRTWATSVGSKDVDVLVLMEWGDGKTSRRSLNTTVARTHPKRSVESVEKSSGYSLILL